MPQMKPIDDDSISVKKRPTPETEMTEEEYEDHLDYCAAVEAIDGALEKGKDGIRRTREFARELGFDF